MSTPTTGPLPTFYVCIGCGSLVSIGHRHVCQGFAIDEVLRRLVELQNRLADLEKMHPPEAGGI